MKTVMSILLLCCAAGGPAWAQQAGKVAAQKEQAELAQPPGAPRPPAPAKDAELRYGPSLYDNAGQAQRDAAKADESDQAPRTQDVENKRGASKDAQDVRGPDRPPQLPRADTGQPGTRAPDAAQPAAKPGAKPDASKPARNKPVARRRSTTQDIATMPPPPPLRAAGPIAPLPPTPPAPVPSAPMPVTCGPAGCLTPSGQLLNKGIGTALIAPDGRTCVRTGHTVQCN